MLPTLTIFVLKKRLNLKKWTWNWLITDFSECAFKDQIGDLVCDDLVNNPFCAFDGGDCCRENSNKLFCESCICYDESNPHVYTEAFVPFTVTTESQFVLCEPISNCLFQFREITTNFFFSIASCENHLLGLIGDSVCDDIANTEVCSFDGGDCCYKDSDFGTCSNCTCYVHVIEVQEEESQIKNDLPKKKKKKKKKKSSAAMRNLMGKTYTLISTLLFVTLRHP